MFNNENTCNLKTTVCLGSRVKRKRENLSIIRRMKCSIFYSRLSPCWRRRWSQFSFMTGAKSENKSVENYTIMLHNFSIMNILFLHNNVNHSSDCCGLIPIDEVYYKIYI